MLELNKLIIKENKKYINIFLIASFHHLKNIEDRLKVFKNIYKLLEN
jgi:hypothetical protein